MTIITKVGASYVNYVNDDTPEVDCFFCNCYQAFSSPRFVRREPGNESRFSELPHRTSFKIDKINKIAI